MKKIITLLSVAIVGSITTQAQLNNAGMETWRNYTVVSASTTLETPDNWFGADSIVYTYAPLMSATAQQTLYKDIDAHGGSYSVKLISADFNSVVVPGLLANAFPDLDFANLDLTNILGSVTYTGGTTVSQRYRKMTAWVKYMPSGSDYGVAAVQALLSGQGTGGTDSVVGGGSVYISAASSYTQITVPIDYADATVVPDKLLITFLSSDVSGESGGTATSGSTLYVDDVDISTVASVKTLFTEASIVSAFPNPVNDVLHLQSANDDALNVKVYNVTGQLMIQESFTKNLSLNVNNFASGVYFYEITNVKKQQIQHGKISVK